METRTAVLLAEAREELARADNKASLLLSASGIGVGALLAGLIAGSWTPTMMTVPAWIIWGIGALCVAIALFLLGRAVFPRTVATAQPRTGLVAYYADVVQVELKDLHDAIAKGSPDAAVEDQLFNISHIVAKKYSDIRWAMILLAAGAGTVLLSLLINTLTAK